MNRTDADPLILEAAEKLFLTEGYSSVVLADVATESGVALPAILVYFPDTAALLQALLDKHSPRREIFLIIRSLRSADSPEKLIRDALEKFINLFYHHQRFVELALIDLQVNEGDYLSKLFAELAAEAAGFINRLSTLRGTRPVSPIILGRAFASLLFGFMATQAFAPPAARHAMRVYPTKAWVDGLADIFLYGIVEQK